MNGCEYEAQFLGHLVYMVRVSQIRLISKGHI